MSTQSPSAPPVLVLFRDDFRLTDNPALHMASTTGQPIVCVSVQDPATRREGAIGWWLDQSRHALAEALKAQGGELLTVEGSTPDIIPDLVTLFKADTVLWNRRYDPIGKEQDTALKTTLGLRHITTHSLSGRLLHEPWAVQTGSGQPYKVFTAWWRAARELGAPGRCVPAPSSLSFAPWPAAVQALASKAAATPAPALPEGAADAAMDWPCTEADAQDFLKDFVEDNVARYSTERDRPDKDTTSRLSPYLRAGLISARQVWHSVETAIEQNGAISENASTFLSELGWRDFAYMQLFYQPTLPTENLRPEFNDMPWHDDATLLKAWQHGQTGYPLVDAGMRQLYQTGWMHNRVRMVVASFLTKHLLTDWRKGEVWFHQRLVDADPAQNAMNWQWCAGTGIDASPWFRIFNPVGQSEKFDPSGAYIRTWVPELRHLPDKLIHTPWKADAALCRQIGLHLGTTYPHPIVDLKAARAIALESYKNLPARQKEE